MHTTWLLTAGLLTVHTVAALAGDELQTQQQILTPTAGGDGRRQPNIILILTDDQDLHMNSLDYMPLIDKHLREKGTLYKRHFCTTAICCPARVSLLTGKLAHNTNVTDVFPPYGGYPKFVSEGFQKAYLPVWLQQAGYDTYYTGKLFNAHDVNNYNNPFPAGWTQSDFLLDPSTYRYYNATFQRNRDPPVSYEGQYSIDVIAEKANGFLELAAQGDKPFFLGIAPPAPHTNVELHLEHIPEGPIIIPPDPDDIAKMVTFQPPLPAKRHEHLFKDVRLPRTPNFNPETPSSVSWIAERPRIAEEEIPLYDHFYRQRLRTLQSVDELVDGVFTRLERLGLLENTYVFYTTDNGYHLAQHRLPPGKECGFEEDINIPLLVRGPNVPHGDTEAVTTHTDLVPTFLRLAGVPFPDGLDGTAIPLFKPEFKEAEQTRNEHVTVEYWGMATFEGGGKQDVGHMVFNNTYKAVRVVSDEYNLYYSVWCNGEHELYDLKTDPYQVKNLLAPGDGTATHLGVSLEQLVARLDTLILVLKSCKGRVCVKPWESLHPQGNVRNLPEALSTRFDGFYTTQQRVHFNRCEAGYVIDAEGPQFETHGRVFGNGIRSSEWW
ncbi:hypothetical protein PV08_05109 [Exophiala spinifera]|uniref:Arylsulfatase n=1 Tax=Exophiala spinifera TaxID=91928 RepID=A0A0D2C2R9_9EURO|nr:uncharacterized protein PV08_05109 [Exophiala spinifera]KIW17914.1 hypothetical protein PV08_05109 [Exophiala spinifera]